MGTADKASNGLNPSRPKESRARWAQFDWRWTGALAALFAGALTLRVWSIGHGLPYAYNVDEAGHFAPLAVGMLDSGWNPHYFENPPAFTYLLKLIFLARWGHADAVKQWIIDPTPLWLTARWTTAILGSLACVLTAVAGARLFSRTVGLLAGAVLATATLPVLYGHFALNDVPASVPVLVVLIAAINLRGEDNRLRDYLMAGAAVGVAASTKYTAGIAVLMLLVAVFPKRKDAIRGLLLAGAAGVVAFTVTNPYAILDMHAFREGLRAQSDFAARKLIGLGDSTGFVYYGSTLTWGLGWIPLAAAGVGLVLLTIRDRSKALLLFITPAALLLALTLNLVLTGEGQAYSRWLLPAYPFLALLAAWAATEAIAATPSKWTDTRPYAVLVISIGVILCAQALWQSVSADRVLGRTDTRQMTRNWMATHIPRKTLIAFDQYVVPPDWFQNTFWAKPPVAGGPGAIWGTALPFITGVHPELIDRFLREGRCWVIGSSTIADRAIADPTAVPNASAYRAKLFANSRIVAQFTPWKAGTPHPRFDFDRAYLYFDGTYKRPGPQITIRRLFGGRCGRELPASRSK